MNVPLLDLKAQYVTIKDDLDRAVADVLQSQHFILGPKVQECEQAIARYSQCAHGIGVSSGTDALLVCLMAEGIGPGHEVITTPYTFFATAGAVARVGAKPVFVDIDPATYNIDVRRIERAVTPQTRAIIPVHLYGQMADMDPIMEIAARRRLTVIEDAAQAIGAESNGRRAGSIGHYGCFSFFPSKNLGAAGDGGMVVTQDKARADKLIKLRAHGSHPKYYHQFIGGNFRLDALQAAVVNVKLAHLDAWTAARQANARRYDRLIQNAGLSVRFSADPDRSPVRPREIILPSPCADRHIYNQYVVRVAERDRIRKALTEKGVSTEIYYPVPMHLQECFAYLGHRPGDFPESEGAANQTIALPIYPELSDAQAEHVVQSLAQALAN